MYLFLTVQKESYLRGGPETFIYLHTKLSATNHTTTTQNNTNILHVKGSYSFS